VSDFVEVVLVQLSYKTGEVTVFEMLGQDSLGELLVLDDDVSKVSHRPKGCRSL
jgi:hypothetical protein